MRLFKRRARPEPRREEEPLGVIPGYRIETARNRYLQDLNLTGDDFERSLNELTPCEACGSGTHTTAACGLNYSASGGVSDDEIIMSSAAVTGQTYDQVLGGQNPFEYAERLREAVYRQATEGGLPFAGLTPIARTAGDTSLASDDEPGCGCCT